MGEQSGFSVASAGDVNGDGFDDVIIGAPFFGYDGEADIVFGQAGGFAPALDLWTLDGTNGFQVVDPSGEDSGVGISVSTAGDVNGDGFADVIIGAPDANGRYGASYVVFGHPGDFTASIDLSSLDGRNGFQINGEAGSGYSGDSVSSAGDLNGDGFDDLIIGAPDFNIGDGSGTSFVVFGHSGEFDRELDLSSLDGSNGFQINGETVRDLIGNSVSSAGDLNGDGFDDVIIGQEAIGDDRVYIVFGHPGGSSANLELSDLDGTNGFEVEGFSFDFVASAGDVNGDGFDDVIIGAEAAGPNGAASPASYVVFGHAGGFAANFDLSTLDGTNGFQINGTGAQAFGGYSVASAGDVNGDGFDDIIIGAQYADPNYSGASYVVFGQAGGFAASLELSDLDGTNGFRISGEAAFDLSGCSVAPGGDVNSDGFDDLIVGARQADPNGLETAGSSYVLFGHAGAFGASIGLSDLNGSNGSQLNGGDLSADNEIIGSNGADDLAGGPGNDTIYGWDGDDILSGDDGADIIFGGAGHDKMVGSVGNDTYEVDSSGDVVVEEANGGTDTVQSSIAYILGSNLDSLTLTGSSAINGTGNSASNVVTGNSAGNVLRGLDGNDTLGGGTGHDKMVGGGGDDTYVVDSSGDVVRERSSGGTDTVQASISYTLGRNQNNLTLTGLSAPDGTGNELNNSLTGNVAGNILDGRGGNDKLIGGGGNDQLIGGADADTFVFQDGDGGDVVEDFEDGIDKFDLRGVAGVHDRTDLHMTDTGHDVLVDYGTGSFLVQNVAGTSLLDAGDFIFA